MNHEWKNVNMSKIVERIHYQHTIPGTSVDQLILTITLERNPIFYILYLLIPSVLMAFVSVLVFLLPPESGERVGLSITVLLSYSVFLLMVSEVTPRGGENTSLLGMYF